MRTRRVCFTCGIGRRGVRTVQGLGAARGREGWEVGYSVICIGKGMAVGVWVLWLVARVLLVMAQG